MHLTCKHIFHYIESVLKEFPAKNFKTRTISMSFFLFRCFPSALPFTIRASIYFKSAPNVLPSKSVDF